MKTLLFIVAVFFTTATYSQTWVTNLQMKAGTWKALAVQYRNISDSTTIAQYFKLVTTFKTKPSDNANVTKDSIQVTTLVYLYEFLLFNVGYADALADFQTSITSKRNTNATLDALCIALENKFAALQNQIKLAGGKALGN